MHRWTKPCLRNPDTRFLRIPYSFGLRGNQKEKGGKKMAGHRVHSMMQKVGRERKMILIYTIQDEVDRTKPTVMTMRS